MNRIQELLTTLVSEGYPLTIVARDGGIQYGRLYRCKTTGSELIESDINKLERYAASVRVKSDAGAEL